MLPIFLYLFVRLAPQLPPDVAMGGGLKQSDLPPLLLGRILAIPRKSILFKRDLPFLGPLAISLLK